MSTPKDPHQHDPHQHDPAQHDPAQHDPAAAQPTSHEAAAVSSHEPDPARPAELDLPVSTILDGYFWERRRRRAVVPIAVGVLGLTALGLIQELPVRHSVERDLTDRSAQALQAAGVQGVDVRFDGRDGTLTGTVTSPAERDSAVNAVRHVTGVRVAHDRLAGPNAAGSKPGSQPGSQPASTPGSKPGSGQAGRPAATPSTAAQAGPQVTAQLRDGRLTLSGSVPSSTARAELVAAIRVAVHPDRISSRISVHGEIAATGLDGLAAVLRALGPDAAVTVELRDGRLTLTGGAASARQIRQAVAAGAVVTGDPQRVVNRLTVDPQVTVAAAVRALPPVTFRTAYSTPTERDQAIIRRLAGVLAANPGVRLRVLGYTDDVGDPDMNYGLSYARARTVYVELQRLGIARARLSFRAYGEKDPKLPNTSFDNRAANRRVEFVLVP